VELHEYNYETAERQIASLNAVKRERQEREVARTLKGLETAARQGKKRDALPLWNAAGPMPRWGDDGRIQADFWRISRAGAVLESLLDVGELKW